MAMKPKKDTYTTSTSGNKTTKTWEYNDGSGSSVTTTNPSKKLDSKFGVKPPAKKKVTPSPKPKTTAKATPKATATPKPTATPKVKAKLTPSEKDFIKGQKLKAKITKKTGVYPNTAN